jgi:hypothetical protein
MTVAIKSVWRWTLAAMAGTVAAYAGIAATAWWRYGSARAPAAADADPLLDRFMPVFDIVERHHITVNAPASVTLQAAGDMDLDHSKLAKAIFRARELVLGSAPVDPGQPRGVLAMTRSLGWGTLQEVPGREIVIGAVTQPWQSDVVFRALPPDQFTAFNDPDFVKIVWTLRADPVGDSKSVFRTETRAVATDAQARRKFRRYWALASPGIFLIRLLSLMPLKAEAERRVRAA